MNASGNQKTISQFEDIIEWDRRVAKNGKFSQFSHKTGKERNFFIAGTKMSLLNVDPERGGGWKLHLTSSVVRHSRKTIIDARSG